MIRTDIPETLAYETDHRSVSPKAMTEIPAASQHIPLPMPVGSTEHVEACHETWAGVAAIRSGRWPSEIMERWGLPGDGRFPEPLAGMIRTEGLSKGVSDAWAWAALVRMDPFEMMGKVMLQTAQRHGARLRTGIQYVDRVEYRDNPDLVGNATAQAIIAAGAAHALRVIFDHKNPTAYPRPWQCSNMPDYIAATLLTLFKDPIVEAGGGHSEYGPGHAYNAGAVLALVLWLIDTVDVDDVDALIAELWVIARACAQGRSAGGLHYWPHVETVLVAAFEHERVYWDDQEPCEVVARLHP